MKRSSTCPVRRAILTGRTRRQHTTIRQAKRRLHAKLKRQIHAARPLPVRALLHPMSVFMLLMAGVLIIGVSLHAAADSYSLRAKVAADPLTEGAIITNPADGTVTAGSPIAVTGSCPDNSYVTLTRNGTYAGTAWCDTNTFSILASLTAGANILQAQDYNITDDPGPTTLSIIVGYNPPVPASPSPSTATHSPAAAPQPALTLSSDYHFRAYATNEDFTWAIQLSGGTAPYTLVESWGDNQHDAETAAQAGTFTLQHHYPRPGYYPIVIKATDSSGTAATLQIAALIRVPSTTTLTFTQPSQSGGLSNVWQAIATSLASSRFLLIAWPTYLVVVLMAISFWLGEHQQLHRLAAAPIRSRSQPKLRP